LIPGQMDLFDLSEIYSSTSAEWFLNKWIFQTGTF